MASSANEHVRQALERARTSEDGHIDPQMISILEDAIANLWRRIQARPDSYVLDLNEFALFNYFRERFRGSTVAQRAVERYWNSCQGNGAKVDSYTT